MSVSASHRRLPIKPGRRPQLGPQRGPLSPVGYRVHEELCRYYGRNNPNVVHPPELLRDLDRLGFLRDPDAPEAVGVSDLGDAVSEHKAREACQSVLHYLTYEAGPHIRLPQSVMETLMAAARVPENVPQVA